MVFTAVCCVAAALFFALGRGSVWGWLGVATCVGLAILSGRSLRKGRDRRITLDIEGFELHEMRGDTRFLWREVSRFDRLEPYKLNSFVVFDDLRKKPGALSLGNSSLLDNYGLTTQAQVDLMNEWRERALAAP